MRDDGSGLERCRRCRRGRLMATLDGDAACLACGHVEYVAGTVTAAELASELAPPVGRTRRRGPTRMLDGVAVRL